MMVQQNRNAIVSTYISSGTILLGQLNYLKFEYLNIPGNVNNFTGQISFQEKKKKTIFGHIRIINLFPPS